MNKRFLWLFLNIIYQKEVYVESNQSYSVNTSVKWKNYTKVILEIEWTKLVIKMSDNLKYLLRQ